MLLIGNNSEQTLCISVMVISNHNSSNQRVQAIPPVLEKAIEFHSKWPTNITSLHLLDEGGDFRQTKSEEQSLLLHPT